MSRVYRIRRGNLAAWWVGGLACQPIHTMFQCATMTPVDPRGEDLSAIREIAARQRGLRLLVLFGSRARGEATDRSDWDLGYLGDVSLDREGLLGDLVAAIGTEAIDLVDLDRAGGLVRFRAARDAVVLFEAADGTFARFWFDAVSYWCDMGPIIRAGYEGILEDLAR